MKYPRNPNHRATYRVEIESDEARLWVGLEAGPVEARFDDISAGGCGFAMGAEEAAGIALGDVLTLRMRVGGAKAPQLFVRGEVRARRLENGTAHIGVQFRERRRLYAQLNEVQWRFFNRRRAFRVAPAGPSGRPLRAKLFCGRGDPGTMYTVRDISATGLAILLGEGKKYPYSEESIVRAEFQLPGFETLFVLGLRFIHRTMLQGRERVGFEIHPGHTRDLEIQSEAILKYVFERQSQLLRSR